MGLGWGLYIHATAAFCLLSLVAIHIHTYAHIDDNIDGNYSDDNQTMDAGISSRGRHVAVLTTVWAGPHGTATGRAVSKHMTAILEY